MATRPTADFGRFFHHYRKFFVFLGCLLAVQVFLAVRIIVLHAESSNSGSNGDFAAAGARIASEAVHNSELKQTERRSSRNPRSSSSSSSDGNFTSLDKNNLPFDIPCEITSKESISAINRARTATCKEQLANAACQIVNDTLYPKRLPRFCVNNVTSHKRYVGCFRDDKNNRILPDSLTLLKESNSPENCVDLCLQAGFQYAGVQYSIECFCGNKKPSSLTELPDKECNMKCPLSVGTGRKVVDYIRSEHESTELYNHSTSSVDPVEGSGKSDQQSCGGFFAMSVYETGVFQVAESGNQVIPVEAADTATKRNQVVKPVRIVYLLTLNGRAFRQVIRLIKSLFHERHFFYIHVDARQDYLFRELLVLSRKLPKNFRFMTNRRATIWGGASLLTVLLNAMEDLVNHAEEWDWPWDYVINLSESDFPLKTTEKLELFLGLNNGKNFIKSHGRDVQKFVQKQGLDKTFYECEYRMWRIGDRVLPKGILIDGGSDWIALHRQMVDYIITTKDELVQGLKIVFKHTLLPAESFFHTVVRNSAMCATFVDNNLHVTNWKRKLGCKCQYRNIVDWCGCSPNDFRLADWPRLQLTENRMLFFGRKFESVVNQAIINKLEVWLYPDRFREHVSTADRFWQNIYHYHDLSPPVDDAVLTLGHSLARIATQVLISKNSLNLSCLSEGIYSSEISSRDEDGDDNVEKPLKVLEMHVFLLNDKIEAVLTRFHVNIPHAGQHLTLEARFGFALLVNDNPKCISEYCGRIREIQVGVDYDQKEQIFRHFSRAMGPYSEPTLAYNSITDEAFNVSFHWINPKGFTKAVINITIPEGSTANFVKPHLTSPLIPGNWTVKVFSRDGGRGGEGDFLMEITFLIMPLQFFKGVPITANQASHDHFHYAGVEDEDQGMRHKRQLTSWIDSLTSRHYLFTDLCVENELHVQDMSSVVHHERDEKIFESINLCKDTGWSSMYPDPKSTIHDVNHLNGFLVP